MHNLEEISKGNCARLSFKRYRLLAKVCVQNLWGSPSSMSLLSLLLDRELKSFNGVAMIESSQHFWQLRGTEYQSGMTISWCSNWVRTVCRRICEMKVKAGSEEVKKLSCI